jgi:cell division protease FtsH
MVFTEKADPFHKVTVIPRGMALGATMSLPEQDRYGWTRKAIQARIRVCFGGRVAEELVCGDISSGAQNDIEQATELARMMVTKWGMSERVGPISYVEGEEHLFLGREVTRTVDHSEATAVLIDSEIKRIIQEALDDTRTLLRENRDGLTRVAGALLAYETLSGDEVKAILNGEDIAQIRSDAAPPSAPPDGRRRPEAAAEGGPVPEGGKPLEGYAY